MKNFPLFIAEVSSNHDRDLGRCLAFVDAAAKAGCGAVKFQMFRIDELFAPEILERSETHRKRRSWELPDELLAPIAARCHELGVLFACTPFSLDAVERLAPHVDFYKVASYELTWPDLIRACAKTGKPVVLSTGMATLDEVEAAVAAAREAGCRDLKVLHCVSNYPTVPADANLAAIETLRKALGCPIGWSDHTVRPGVIQRAIHHWGAEVIEFHLDLDGKGAEYAAGHCWLPHEIASVIRDLRDSFEADGAPTKQASRDEIPERDWRADPSDGLRPFKHLRATWKP
ncbi:N-acetylneuraminate synthase family protein [Roseiterribacter gracilis]|uniref:N-acetylneuraminic acid synthase n=1 Tax=Roseiterribacter gracilis TaxID=2812848 RepID=A0A8S8XHJ2_9PROT|nr:N-acetylneuraminic acid synthase [Rhodospirillales bacterium TMPK1]